MMYSMKVEKIRGIIRKHEGRKVDSLVEYFYDKYGKQATETYETFAGRAYLVIWHPIIEQFNGDAHPNPDDFNVEGAFIGVFLSTQHDNIYKDRTLRFCADGRLVVNNGAVTMRMTASGIKVILGETPSSDYFTGTYNDLSLVSGDWVFHEVDVTAEIGETLETAIHKLNALEGKINTLEAEISELRSR